jgi:prepilin-type N-terminal cleavage/methylation domain-containing protein
MSSSKRGFTLIEILVSVMILAIVGTGLLQMSINAKRNFEYLRDKEKFDTLASIAFVHNDISLHNKDLTLYEILEDSYTDIDDEVRSYLKSIKIGYTQKQISSLSIGDDQNETTDKDESESVDSLFNLTLIYDKITVFDKNSSTYTYKIYIPMQSSEDEAKDE